MNIIIVVNTYILHNILLFVNTSVFYDTIVLHNKMEDEYIMSNVEYLKAAENDFEELIDFTNLVFSVYAPSNFEVELPTLYKKQNFMTGTNYIVKEDGRIVANVGAYPFDYSVCKNNLKINAVTVVAVHTRARSKGYMKKLMEMALSDMHKDSTDLSFLYGLRQRYEYFGYTPCGVRLEYTCNKHNIQHFFGEISKNIIIKEADASDTEIFDEVFKSYHSGNAYVKRPRERFTDIMATWQNKTLGIYNEDRFIGYISTSKDHSAICEFNINDKSLLGDVLGAYLEKFQRFDVNVTVFPFETELNLSLSKFADSVSVQKDGNYYVINYINVLNSFLKLKCENNKIPDGEITFHIREFGNISISVDNNYPSVAFTDKKPDVEVSKLDATQLFFSPVASYLPDISGKNDFTRCLFPIPLFVRRLDRS